MVRVAAAGPAIQAVGVRRLTFVKSRVLQHAGRPCCRFSCRLTPTLSGIAKCELRQITLSVNELLISCRTSYSPAVA